MANLRIKELCNKRGITQKSLAEKIGLSPVGLAKAIAGNSTITTLERIADGLNVPVSELFAPSKDGVITCPNCGARLDITPHVEGGDRSEESN